MTSPSDRPTSEELTPFSGNARREGVRRHPTDTPRPEGASPSKGPGDWLAAEANRRGLTLSQLCDQIRREEEAYQVGWEERAADEASAEPTEPYDPSIWPRVSAPGASADWRCECGDLNRLHEDGCYRCGAGQPELPEHAAGMRLTDARGNAWVVEEVTDESIVWKLVGHAYAADDSRTPEPHPQSAVAVWQRAETANPSKEPLCFGCLHHRSKHLAGVPGTWGRCTACDCGCYSPPELNVAASDEPSAAPRYCRVKGCTLVPLPDSDACSRHEYAAVPFVPMTAPETGDAPEWWLAEPGRGLCCGHFPDYIDCPCSCHSPTSVAGQLALARYHLSDPEPNLEAARAAVKQAAQLAHDDVVDDDYGDPRTYKRRLIDTENLLAEAVGWVRAFNTRFVRPSVVASNFIERAEKRLGLVDGRTPEGREVPVTGANE